MEKNILFKTSGLNDLSLLARCHKNAFPFSLAAALGSRYCENMLSWYIFNKKTFLIHLEDEHNNIIGYCGGIIKDEKSILGSASGMAQHSFYNALRALVLRPWVVFHPEIRAKWPFFWKNIKMKLGWIPRPSRKNIRTNETYSRPQIGLVVIGVDPAFQGKGYGSLLIKEFESYAVNRYGVSKLRLTVRSKNHKAISAYEKNGWKVSKSDKETIKMVKLL